MIISYNSFEPGLFLVDKIPKGIVYDLSCNKSNEGLSGKLSGQISANIIYDNKSLQNPGAPSELKRQLTKNEITALLEKLTIKILAFRDHIPSQKVELVIGNLEIKEGTRPIFNFVDSIESYYIKNFEFKAKVQQEIS